MLIFFKKNRFKKQTLFTLVNSVRALFTKVNNVEGCCMVQQQEARRTCLYFSAFQIWNWMGSMISIWCFFLLLNIVAFVFEVKYRHNNVDKHYHSGVKMGMAETAEKATPRPMIRCLFCNINAVDSSGHAVGNIIQLIY